jgi:hypothetical protein
MLVIWQIDAVPLVPFNMYNIDDRQDGYCLSHYVYKPECVIAYQIIPYCLRSFEKGLLNIINTFDSKFTFIELQEKNVSSEMLLSWSASIDLAEKYEIFLNNLSYSSSSFEKEILFYNCTSPWFGPLCLFAFDPEIDASFNKIVTFTFDFDINIVKEPSITCYEHLECGRASLCLDWREICDRKIDCLDGSDELNCWQLEMNECTENEFRCHNGQCIPAKFFHDTPVNPDCMDGTDEPVGASELLMCLISPASRREEHICRQGIGFFPCGDGQCSYGISRCRNDRDTIFLNDTCSRAMACDMRRSYYNQFDLEWCEKFCPNINCVQDYCSLLYEFPPRPIAFGHVRFIYNNTKTKEATNIYLPDYVCYDENLCENFYPATTYINGLTCRHLYELEVKHENLPSNLNDLVAEIHKLFHICLLGPNETHYCNHSIMYQCYNSAKCISKHRLVDGIQDCPLNDDETYNHSCSLNDANHRFNCTIDNSTKCFAPVIIEDEKEHCQNGEDELEYRYVNYRNVNFQAICNGIEDRQPELIDGRNETDETDCKNWPCNNTYSRCDGFWSCEDGADDINCPSSTCPQFEHSCVFLNDTSKVSCLPIARAGNGIIDCLGATDERNHCRYEELMYGSMDFRCWNDTKCLFGLSVCDQEKDCPFDDDEIFCTKTDDIYCTPYDQSPRTEVEKFICDFMNGVGFGGSKYFRLQNVPTYPKQLTSNIISRTLPVQTKTQLIESNPVVHSRFIKERRCNRGLPIKIRRSNDTSKLYCLCPPSYYGDKCQYQNQRVSLTLQIRIILDWHTVLTFIITLIDNERNIESHEHIEYLSLRDCDTKFHVYLLYSTRPKHSEKNYSIQIDLFNKITLKYRARWIFPLQFSFLPVYNLAVLLEVPTSDVEILQTCQPPCIHGKCLNYVNDQRSTFCQCSPGWSGVQCSIEYRCDCASNLRCIGKSICLCPLGRYGPRCHLRQLSCNSESCVNDGQCVTKYEHYVSSDLKSSMCICPPKYTGDRCEYQQTRIEISFHPAMNIPLWLYLHFIKVKNDSEPIRTSVMKNIPYDQNSLSLYTSISFNLAFAEMFNNKYYLIILREEDIFSMNIFTMINPSYQCISINELFNVTFANRHLLIRIKSYHIPCQQRLELVCFYDDVHFCLCNLDRQANCFKFTHNLTYDCGANSLCENGGECFEDHPRCPSSFICVCLECYYGSRCQISARGSTLSLDVILGYQIRPNTGISQQSTAVKIAITFSIITLVLGLISSLLTFLTFRMKNARIVGCGLYLLASSITSMVLMIVLTIKFLLLLKSQMGSINNRLFIHVQCVSLDYFLRLLLSANDWLSVCVGIERTVNVLQGIKFDKRKSKRVAKWIIIAVFILTICTYIHDPIHRDLVDDEEEQRIWCVTKYSLSLQQFDLAINIFHFCVPFLINLISPLIIIITAAKSRSNSQEQQSYTQSLCDQLRHHKHLFISPFILFLLALPRLIISFLSGCMKSARNPWLYLIGYFISFTPSILTFVVYVLPSKTYKQEFSKSIQSFWKI